MGNIWDGARRVGATHSIMFATSARSRCVTLARSSACGPLCALSRTIQVPPTRLLNSQQRRRQNDRRSCQAVMDALAAELLRGVHRLAARSRDARALSLPRALQHRQVAQLRRPDGQPEPLPGLHQDGRHMRVLIVLLILVMPANSKPWPVSQCTNGWVDRMTGMCPYRPPVKRQCCPPATRKGIRKNLITSLLP